MECYIGEDEKDINDLNFFQVGEIMLQENEGDLIDDTLLIQDDKKLEIYYYVMHFFDVGVG